MLHAIIFLSGHLSLFVMKLWRFVRFLSFSSLYFQLCRSLICVIVLKRKWSIKLKCPTNMTFKSNDCKTPHRHRNDRVSALATQRNSKEVEPTYLLIWKRGKIENWQTVSSRHFEQNKTKTKIRKWVVAKIKITNGTNECTSFRRQPKWNEQNCTYSKVGMRSVGGDQIALLLRHKFFCHHFTSAQRKYILWDCDPASQSHNALKMYFRSRHERMFLFSFLLFEIVIICGRS